MAVAPARPRRLLPRVAGAVIVVGGLVLCGWQLRRDGERNAGREAALLVEHAPVITDDDLAAGDPTAPGEGAAWRRVSWSGRFLPGAVLEAARDENHERGYGLLQAFERDRGGVVLVDRGWVPVDKVVELVAEADADRAPRVLTGQLRALPPSGEFPVFQGAGGVTIRQPDARAAAAAALGATVPLALVAGGAEGQRTTRTPALDGFVAVPERDDTSLHYAAQWFAIAVVGLVLAVVGKIPGIGKTADAEGPHPP